jgi:hypothetical protein
MKIVITLILFAAGCAGASPQSNKFETVHTVNASAWELVFPSGGQIDDPFVASHVAIEILELYCDGIRLQPEVVEGAFRLNYAKYGEGRKYLIYRLDSKGISFVYRKDGAIDHNKMVRYTLVGSASKIVCRYVIWNGRGSRTEALTLTSHDRNSVPIAP